MDIDAQKAETEETFARLSRRYILPDEVPLGLQFIPLDAPGDRDGFVKAAEALGYEAIWFPGEDEEDQADGYLELERVISPITFDEIWRHESLLSEVALRYGFAADGWGFLIPLDEVDQA
ncbi:hypothetical protein MASR2M74_34970 [Paracoccaceae bacterium]